MTRSSLHMFVRISAMVRGRWAREDGASMVEYALLIGLIAVVAVVAVTFFGSQLSGEYDRIASTMP